MLDLDETDLEILDLLIEDARRPYSDIAERVGVSGPTVSERVDRLRDRGVIKRFTLDLDRDRLVDGIGLLIELRVVPGHAEAVIDDLVEIGAVEHAFRTADDRIVAHARLDPQRARATLDEHLDFEVITALDLMLLQDVRWSPRFDAVGFDVDCVECGNTVTAQGTTRTIDGDRYQFCCPSCADRFAARYAELAESA